MFNSFQSNRIEALAVHLSQIISFDPLSPFDREVVLVESSAMSQWLMQAIAKNNGVAANIDFPFPAALLWQVYRLQQQGLPSMSTFDRVPLTYRLYDYFNDGQKKQCLLKDVSLYIDQLINNRQLFEFCEYLAGLYDQYQIYRPEMLMAWKACRDEDNFQAAIWYDLHQTQADKDNDKDRAEVFFDTVNAPLKNVDKLGFKRLHVFALSNLPAAYMAILAKLGESMEVNLFVLNPCALFWSDSKQQKQLPNEACEGNPLLAMMAHQASDFQRLLEEYPVAQTTETFIEAPANNVLGYLQADILHLRQRAVDSPKICLESDDNSLVLHATHGPLREVQIVKNQILSFLNANKTANFDQIVIMVSDLERYSPYFHSVFLSDINPLPFHIAERRSLDASSVKIALLNLLSMKSMGFTRSSIVDCLKLPAVSRAFGLTDIPLVEQLLDDLSVHFGLADKDWETLGEHVVSMAFEQGMTRLMASFCLPAAYSDDLIVGVDEQVADQAGRLCEFIDRLDLLQRLNTDKSAVHWVDTIESLIAAFIQVDDDAEQAELREIRTALEKWQEQVVLSGCESFLDFDTFNAIFEGLLENMPVQHYFRKDVINIATLLPMRSLPFEMVCLLGMNDGEFPRPESKDPLDYMQASPKVGDRNRQSEERYLFLEAILAARKKVHISYTGKSTIDNSERFPSLLVAELLDYLQSGFCFEDNKSVRDQLVISHPLQAFDARYFDGQVTATESMQSYDEALHIQANALQSEKKWVPFADSMSDTEKVTSTEEFHEYSVKGFVDALYLPQKTYLNAIGIYPRYMNAEDGDVELMTVSGLESYSLLQQLLAEGRESHAFSTASLSCQNGLIPQGQIGKKIYEKTLSLAESLLAPLGELGLHDTKSRYPLELTFGKNHRVVGIVGGFNAKLDKRLCFIGKNIHGVHIFKAWVEHVLIQAERGIALHSYIVGEKNNYMFVPLEQSVAKAFVSVWGDRTEQASEQLVHFFVRSSFQYFLEKKKEKGNEEVALLSAMKGGFNTSGEKDQDVFSYAYRDQEIPYDLVLAEAKEMFEPMETYLEITKR